MAKVPSNYERSCTTVQGRAEESLFLELVARSWNFRGNSLEFAWDFRGFESLYSKQLFYRLAWVFRATPLDPLQRN